MQASHTQVLESCARRFPANFRGTYTSISQEKDGAVAGKANGKGNVSQKKRKEKKGYAFTIHGECDRQGMSPLPPPGEMKRSFSLKCDVTGSGSQANPVLAQHSPLCIECGSRKDVKGSFQCLEGLL